MAPEGEEEKRLTFCSWKVRLAFANPGVTFVLGYAFGIWPPCEPCFNGGEFPSGDSESGTNPLEKGSK